MDVFTRTAFVDDTTEFLATLPVDTSKPYIYFLKLANEGTLNQMVEIEQLRHENAYKDRSVIPAASTTPGTIPKGDTKAWGGKPEEDQLLIFDAGGTINAQLNKAAEGGSIAVTAGFAIP